MQVIWVLATLGVQILLNTELRHARPGSCECWHHVAFLYKWAAKERERERARGEEAPGRGRGCQFNSVISLLSIQSETQLNFSKRIRGIRLWPFDKRLFEGSGSPWVSGLRGHNSTFSPASQEATRESATLSYQAKRAEEERIREAPTFQSQ